MTTYSIYAKANDATAADGIFLPDAFSWGAFIFTWIWALWNRMWIVGVLVLSVMLIAFSLPAVPQFLLVAGACLLMGFHGNDLLGWSLRRRGFAPIGLGHGSSLEEAELRFYADGVDAPMQTSPTPVNHDVLGLFGSRS